MKPIFIIFAFCLSTNTYAQQLNKKTEKLPLLIKLKYQNTERLFPDNLDLKPDLYNQIMLIGVIETVPKNSFNLNTKKLKFTFSETLQIDLTKELRN